MRHTRTFVAAATVALALAGVSACSAAEQATSDAASAAAALPADATAVLGLASTKIQSQDSAKITATVQMPGAAMPEQVTGGMAWGSDPRIAGAMTGVAGMSQVSSTGSVPVLIVDGAMFFKMSTADALAHTNGKHWMKLDFAELAAISKNPTATTAGAGMENMLKQLSPVQTVRELAADKGVKNEGEETMDGVQTTHFSGHVTIDQILAATPGLTASQRATLGKADAAAGMTGEDVDIWLNDQALPVRVREHGMTQKGDFDIDRHFSDYGMAVSATVPSASDTFDLASQLEKLKNLNGAA